MRNFIFILFALCLLCPGEMTKWPVHTICKVKDFEAYYISCDPLQDAGVSFMPCSRTLTKDPVIKVGIILRRDIKSLYVNSNIYYNGALLLHQRKTLCDEKAPRFFFCGKKKGESVFYEHPIKFGVPFLPKGDYIISFELLNEDNYKIGCTNFTLYSHP